MNAGRNRPPSRWYTFGCIPLAASLLVLSAGGQEPSGVQAAVVKITGTPRPGTGVVVALEQGVATVLTASHVIRGARTFQVVFSARPDIPSTDVPSRDVVGMQSDERHGLAAFRVRGVPGEVRAIRLEIPGAPTARQDLVYWGYPNNAPRLRSFGGTYSGLEGTLLMMDRSVGEGASGGPIVKGDSVVGIATATDAQSTFAVLSDVAAIALRGWNVRLPTAATTSQPSPTAATTAQLATPAEAECTAFYGTYAMTLKLLSGKASCGPVFGSRWTLSGREDCSNFRVYETGSTITFSGTIDANGRFKATGSEATIEGTVKGRQIDATDTNPDCTFTVTGSRD